MATVEDGVPIWARPEPGWRHPRFTRAGIAAVALEIADREGFEAVSMRRVAAELDAGTMSLYHYVRSKADLIALMDDALMTEALVPEAELVGGWRAALTQVARRTRAMLLHHPWALGAFQESQFGPNAMRHFEQSLAAAEGTGLEPPARLELLALVDDYVFGSALHAVESLRRAALARADPDTVRRAVEFGVAQMRSGAFPQIEALATGGGPGGGASVGPPMDTESIEAQFERGLQAVLDGAALRMGLATGPVPPAPPG
ncbi:MAG: TetR/AcrR family transcriptional regulator [Candidatus Dormiibacterota bacterium]|jgi:AcrR family transcriptional regulator